MLSDETFAIHFKDSFRALWLTALGLLHDAAWAEDVVQEAALVGLRKLDQFKHGTSFTAWMGQIVRYLALNKVRHLNQRNSVSLEPELLEDPSASEGTAHKGKVLTQSGQLPALQEHFDDRLRAHLLELKRVPRACLLLRTVEGLDYDEISAILDIPRGTAMSHVHRARSHLREAMASGTASEGVGS